MEKRKMIQLIDVLYYNDVLKKLVEYEIMINMKVRNYCFFFIWNYLFILIASVPKIMLLYGGDVHHVKSIYKLMNVEFDQEKFGLVILRVLY